jgi:hypothetical protein
MYKIRKAELSFDKNGKLKKIVTTAEMPGNPGDVRKIEAESSNWYWESSFEKWNVELQKILQKTTAEGGEI